MNVQIDVWVVAANRAWPGNSRDRVKDGHKVRSAGRQQTADSTTPLSGLIYTGSKYQWPTRSNLLLIYRGTVGDMNMHEGVANKDNHGVVRIIGDMGSRKGRKIRC